MSNVPNMTGNTSDSQLSVLDWVLAIVCSGIGCIVGIVYLIQGKPKAPMMIGVSLVMNIIWAALSWYFRGDMPVNPVNP